MDSGLAFEEKAFLSADRLTVWRTNSAVMMLARQSILALCRERCCFKMSENPLEFGMVCVVVKLTLCYVFQRVLFFCRVRRYTTKEFLPLREESERRMGDIRVKRYVRRTRPPLSLKRVWVSARELLVCWEMPPSGIVTRFCCFRCVQAVARTGR